MLVVHFFFSTDHMIRQFFFFFCTKNRKKASKKASKKSMPKKHRTNDAKMIKNEAKMDAQIGDISYFFEKGENARNYLFYNRRWWFGHAKHKK